MYKNGTGIGYSFLEFYKNNQILYGDTFIFKDEFGFYDPTEEIFIEWNAHYRVISHARKNRNEFDSCYYHSADYR
jgi:hypothetical protein